MSGKQHRKAHFSEENVQNINTDTSLIQHPLRNKSIAHVFDFPSTEKTIAYYHAATGFPTKETCMTPFEQEIMIPGQGSASKMPTNTSQKVIRHKKVI